MRKITAVIALSIAMLAVSAVPAGAERPPQVQAGVTFPDVNACTGQPELVTLSWVITLHHNRRNTVATFATTIETSSGFSGTGRETEVMTGDKLLNTLNIRMTNDDGQVAMVKGHRRINLDSGEVVTNSFRTYCVRD